MVSTTTEATASDANPNEGARASAVRGGTTAAAHAIPARPNSTNNRGAVHTGCHGEKGPGPGSAAAASRGVQAGAHGSPVNPGRATTPGPSRITPGRSRAAW